MLLEPGPLQLLDPERVIGPRLAYGFEELTTQLRVELEGARARIDANASTMAGDLDGSPTVGLESIVARAAGEHASQLAQGEMQLAPSYFDALGLYDELATKQAQFPPEGTVPSLPGLEDLPDDVFDELELPGPTPAPAPRPGPGPGVGDGGDDGGGDGDGSPRPREARELVELYYEQNPTERARIDRFLADNDRDWERAPAALELPGWAEFVARNR